MRPVLALALACGILGLVQSYMVFQRTAPRAQAAVLPVAIRAEGRFEIEATLTFDAAPDDFDVRPASLEIRQVDEELLRLDTPLPAGETVRIEAELENGFNEFYVRAWPADNASKERAMRVRVLRDGVAVAEQTLWSQPGEPVEGPIRLEIEPPPHSHP